MGKLMTALDQSRQREETRRQAAPSVLAMSHLRFHVGPDLGHIFHCDEIVPWWTRDH